MSTDSWIEVTVAIVALGMLGLAALVEASLATVNRVTLRALIEERVAANRVQSLIERPQSLRSTMLLIELIAAGIVAVMVTDLFSRELDAYGWIVGLIVTTFAVVVVGRVLPGAVIAAESMSDSHGFPRVASVLAFLAAPLTLIADWMIRGLTPLFDRANASGEDGLSEDGGSSRADYGSAESHDSDDIEEDEHEMISGVLRLDQAAAREIMVPRPDIIGISVDMPIFDVVDIIRKAGHSRIPVYRDSIDTIVGVIYAKDLLRFVREDLEEVNILELLRPAYYVPESKRVDELLKDLRQEKVHLAIVVDEYGGTAGLVTIEDILEEIVGEIQDEYDHETPLVERIGPEEIIVDGRIGVDEVADIFATHIAEGDFETIGGFVQKMLGRIPQAGESLRADGLLIEVQAVERRRVRKLRIVRIDDSSTVDTESQAGVH